MRSVLTLIILLASTGSSAAAQEESPYQKVFNMGVTQCVEVNEHFDKDGFQAGLEIWLGGYYTAVNNMLIDIPFSFSQIDLENSINAIKVNCSKSGSEELAISTIISEYWRSRIKSTYSSNASLK